MNIGLRKKYCYTGEYPCFCPSPPVPCYFKNQLLFNEMWTCATIGYGWPVIKIVPKIIHAYIVLWIRVRAYGLFTRRRTFLSGISSRNSRNVWNPLKPIRLGLSIPCCLFFEHSTRIRHASWRECSVSLLQRENEKQGPCNHFRVVFSLAYYIFQKYLNFHWRLTARDTPDCEKSSSRKASLSILVSCAPWQKSRTV